MAKTLREAEELVKAEATKLGHVPSVFNVGATYVQVACQRCAESGSGNVDGSCQGAIVKRYCTGGKRAE